MVAGGLRGKEIQKGVDNVNVDFPVAQTVKNLPAMQETRVQSLGREDPLEKGMAVPSRILAWRIPTDRGAWRATVTGSQSRMRVNTRICKCIIDSLCCTAETNITL